MPLGGEVVEETRGGCRWSKSCRRCKRGAPRRQARRPPLPVARPALKYRLRTNVEEKPRHETRIDQFCPRCCLADRHAGLRTAAQQASPSPPQQPQQSRPPVRSDLGANVRVFDVPPGSRPHDVAPAPDGRIWYTGQRAARSASSTPRPARSRSSARRWLGAARRDRGARRQRLDHRRRLERDRELRPAFRRRSRSIRCPRNSPIPTSTPPPSTATACSGSPARPVSTAGSIRRAARCGCSRPEGARSLWHHRDARPARSIMSRSPAATSAHVDRETGQATVIEPPTPESGRPAGLGGRERQRLGHGMERRPAQPLHAVDRRVAELALPKAPPRSTRSMSTTAASSGSAISAPTPCSASIPPPSAGPLSGQRRQCQCPPDPRRAGLDLPARIGPRPDHGGQDQPGS